MTLDDEDIQAIAAAVAEALQAVTPRRLVDAETAAKALGISKAAVWRNASQLGGVKIGDGPRPRWRFDLDTLGRQAEDTPTAPRPRRHRHTSKDTQLLPVRE